MRNTYLIIFSTGRALLRIHIQYWESFLNTTGPACSSWKRAYKEELEFKGQLSSLGEKVLALIAGENTCPNKRARVDGQVDEL